jgi:hypothetical protein
MAPPGYSLFVVRRLANPPERSKAARRDEGARGG